MAHDGRDLLRTVPAARAPRGRRFGETSSLRLPEERSHTRLLSILVLILLIAAVVYFFYT